MRPPDLPPAEAYPHGVRARYVSGCRCEECRRANREYAHSRALATIRGQDNGLVSASRAKAHLDALSKKGIGRRSVQDIAGVGDTTLQEIRSGKKTLIRKQTETAILAVTSEVVTEAMLVSGRGVLATLERMREHEGWTHRELAKRLGYKGNVLQFGDKITTKSLQRINRFLKENHWRFPPKDL
jgi:hypothetical protein